MPLDVLFKLLSHPLRLAILHCLLSRAEANAAEILRAVCEEHMDPVPTLGSVRHCVDTLYNAGLIGQRNDGGHTWYRATLPDWIADVIREHYRAGMEARHV